MHPVVRIDQLVDLKMHVFVEYPVCVISLFLWLLLNDA